MAFKIAGGLLVLFGVVDLIGSFTGFDIWTDVVGVDLPEAIWSFTAYIEIGIGYFLYKQGSKATESDTDGIQSSEE